MKNLIKAHDWERCTVSATGKEYIFWKCNKCDAINTSSKRKPSKYWKWRCELFCDEVIIYDIMES